MKRSVNYFSGARARAGVTLVELLIAMAVLTIGIAGLVQSFSFIQKAVQMSKNKSLASNLAQEKMQILKQKTYYEVLVTTDPSHDSVDFAPEVVDYDTGFFPPEIITEAGVVYTRYTYVQSLREDSGVMGTIAPDLPDAGMKRITITVVWGYGNAKRKLTLRSILANPDTVMSNAVFNGVVQTTMSVPIGGSLVQLVENPACGDTTDSAGINAGKFFITTTPGTYTLIATAPGYYTGYKSYVIAAGETKANITMNLSKIATGRVTGYPWLRDHLVISQVMGSTISPAGIDQEYVEVFNPTDHTWTMTGAVGLKFQRAGDPEKAIQIDYRSGSSSIEKNKYYLFASTGNITVNGVTVKADAVWSASNSITDFKHFARDQNIIPVEEDAGLDSCWTEGGGALELYNISDGSTLDRVGWSKSTQAAPFYEGVPITASPSTNGLYRGELYARMTNTGDTAGVTWSFGPAYDSNNNNVDFVDYIQDIGVPVHNTFSSSQTVISGTPAIGAVVSCADGLSASTEALSLGGSGVPAYAYFSLVNVSTGSWTVLISSGLYKLEQTINLVNGGDAYNFPSTATWLSQINDRGIISGRVLDALGQPIPTPTIYVTSGGADSTIADPSTGKYNLRVAPGVVDIVANPTVVGSPSSYVSASSNSIAVNVGEVHSGTDFVLYQGGRLNGFISRGNNTPLPGVTVAIFDEYGVARDQQVSDAYGDFTSVVLSTGLYTVEPSLGKLESTNPVTSTVTVTMAGNPFCSTFTVAGAMGTISGSVKFHGKPIQTGVLIVVSTKTLGSPPLPPDLSSNTLTGSPYYLVSSMENGTYTLDVRGSTNPPYYVNAFYPVPTGNTAVPISSTTSNVVVNAGATTTGVDFSW